MWSSCFARIGKNGHILTFRLQWMRSETNLQPEEFFKKFCSDWKKLQFWCPCIMGGEYIARGDEYGKRQPL